VTDEDVEGQYKSAINGDLVTYLPWEVSEPNGFKDQNLVLIKISSMGYFDNVSTMKASCTACDIEITTTFSLIGVCKDTYFGKNKWLQIKQALLLFQIHSIC
jgi:hypothetical protein